MILHLTAGVPSRPSLAGRPELAGVRGFLVSEHRFKKEKHQDAEKLHANSPRRSVRADWKGIVLVTVKDVRGCRRDPIRVV